MSIRFYCPLGHRLLVPDTRAGKKGRCPICHQRVIVPVADPQPSGRRKRPARQQIVADPPELESILEAELGLAPPDGIPSPPPAPPMAPAAIPPASTAPHAQPPLPPAARPPEAFVTMPFEPPRPGAWITHPAPGDPRLHLDKHDLPHRQTAFILATCIAFVSLASAYPTLRCLGAGEFPLWMPLTTLVALAGLVYAIWLASLPDWSTERVGVALFTAVAIAYAAVWGLILTTRDQVLPFDLQPYRNYAGGWSAANALVFGLTAFVLFWASGQWRFRGRRRVRVRA